MALKYKLTYFDGKGLAEPIRYMLSYMGEEFEDDRFTKEEWPLIKPSTPFGKAPVLSVDGKQLCQSVALTRYLAKKTDLAGKDEWEDLQIDMIVDTIGDLRQAIAAYYYDPDEESRAAKKEPLLNETIPFYMSKFENIAKENNGYLANGRLSWADIYLVALGEYMSFIAGTDLLEPYPTLTSLKEIVWEIPQIKEWIEKRPKTDL